MKKFIAILLVAMMALSLVACGEKPAPTPDPTPSASTYKTGLGMVTSMSGTDAEDEDPAKTEADVTVCEATFDQDGKIVAISFDVVQAKATVDADGVVTVAEDVKTKLELGEDYGMRGASALGKEWYEHSEGFCDALKGKTRTEIAGLSGGDADLKALCTIDITDLQKAALDALS